MAGSRTERIRSIFQRCQRLMGAGGLPESEKPLWYDVYAAFPPKVEPLYKRPVPTKVVRNILYPEDLIRAKYFKEIYDTDLVDLRNEQETTTSQKFIDKYFELRENDRNNPDLFAATVEALKDDGIKLTTWQEREKVTQIYKGTEHPSRKPSYTAEEVFGELTITREKQSAGSKDNKMDDMEIDNLAADLFDSKPKL
ncbi:28S ribosomal protein S23, mitochondrial-like [Mizuhopecten yessoensis]|uniref:Small ribosomal subunit protein mS23 n=1 Tax=Mizuhopecten yessoensis TaxID=6573 RepID=A0A210PRM5_MIZYE|nr:28S ribosomal protein S23, mitochondrial-like [Mizuhopecten yessoensis]OWF39140.1 28S ribosomal protein S23, mitochondrial [Mizuhopecten yessoensis]